MKIVVIEPHKTPYINNVSNDVLELQDIIGGNIEYVQLRDYMNDRNAIYLILVCKKERAVKQNNYFGSILSEKIFITAIYDVFKNVSHDEFRSLTEKEIKFIRETF